MFLNENKYVYLPDIKCEKMDYEKIVQDLDLQSENIFEIAPVNEGRKRMRLHQLTWEEKIQRKKLRNRIAAQTSRDRKKAKMDHLEESVKELKQQNDLLFIEVQELKRRNEVLMDKNAELEKALAERPYTCSCMKKAKEEWKEIVEKPNEIEEQICVEDGFTYERPAESSEIPQQKGCWPTSAQVLTKTSSWEMLSDFKGDKFLDDLERLASSLLEEVERNEGQRSTESLLKEVSGVGQQKCSNTITMVGKASEKLEPCRSEMNLSFCDQEKSFWSKELSLDEKIWFISFEHSYAAPGKSNISELNASKSQTCCSGPNVPNVIVSESDKISAIENELKKDIEPKLFNCKHFEGSNLDVVRISNFCSPRSEVSSDQGYESPGSPNESEFFKMDAFDDLNKLWDDPFSELFPDLM